jgi:hypothetical protein
MEGGDAGACGMGLPKNLSRDNRPVIVIGFNGVLHFPQLKPVQPGVQPAAPQSLMGANAI